MKRIKILLWLTTSVFFFFLISLYSATSVGIADSDLTEGRVVYIPQKAPTNYSLIPTVNSSDFWDNLDTPADLDGLLDSYYVPYTGATANVDLGAYDLSAQDIVATSSMTTPTIFFDNLQNNIWDDGNVLKISSPDSIVLGVGVGAAAYTFGINELDLGNDNLQTTGFLNGSDIYATDDLIVGDDITMGGEINGLGITTNPADFTLSTSNQDFTIGMNPVSCSMNCVNSGKVLTIKKSCAIEQCTSEDDNVTFYNGSFIKSLVVGNKFAVGTMSPTRTYGTDNFMEVRGASNPAYVLRDTGQTYPYHIVADGNDVSIMYGSVVLFSCQNDGKCSVGSRQGTHDFNVIGDVNITGTIINPAIYCESSDLNDQTFAVAGVRYRLNISNIDEGNGITMESGGNNGTNISIDVSGVYHLVAQPQVKAGAGGAGDFHMWIEKFSSGVWADISDSNIELKLSSLEEDVIVLATTLKLNQGEKLRLVVSVSDNKILLHAQSPAGEPVIPSIIFTMYRIGS